MPENPFAPPASHAAPDSASGPHAERLALLHVEARIIAVGWLWTLGGYLQAGVSGTTAVASLSGAVFGNTDGLIYLVAAAIYGVAALVGWWFAGLGEALRALRPMPVGDLRWWALFGLCFGPCGTFNLIAPFLLLRRDAARVMTRAHQELRAQTPELRADGVGTAALLVLGAIALVAMVAVALVLVLSALGSALEANFVDVG